MTLLLVDGQNLQHRSLYGAAPLTRAVDDRPVGGVVAFLRTLIALIERYVPTTGAVVFDGPGKCFRRHLSDRYKSMREPREEDAQVAWQVAAMRVAVASTGMRVSRSYHLEADDVIATLALAHRGPVVVCSDDKDLQQLVKRDGVVVHRFRDRGRAPVTRGTVHEQWGVEPEAVHQVQALAGDGGDGVAGLHGLGRKTAARLLTEYHSAEHALMHADRWRASGWAAHAAEAHAVRGMVHAVRAVEDCEVREPPTALRADWASRLAGVMLALNARAMLDEHCARHRLSVRAIRPHEVLAPVRDDVVPDLQNVLS